MFNEDLIGYDDLDYIYVIEGCMDYYFSDEPLDINAGPCEVCGSYDWPFIDGYVCDIRKALDENDFYNIKEAREMRERLIEVRNVLSSKSYNGLIDSINEVMYEEPKRLILR